MEKQELGLVNKQTLLKLIAENPYHELKFFVQDDIGDYYWNECDINMIKLEYMALYNDEEWLDKEDYEEKLYDDLANEYEDDDHLKQAVENEMEKVEFKEYICVFLS